MGEQWWESNGGRAIVRGAMVVAHWWGRRCGRRRSSGYPPCLPPGGSAGREEQEAGGVSEGSDAPRKEVVRWRQPVFTGKVFTMVLALNLNVPSLRGTYSGQNIPERCWSGCAQRTFSQGQRRLKKNLIAAVLSCRLLSRRADRPAEFPRSSE